MINYQITCFMCRPHTSTSIPILKHYLCVCIDSESGACFLWRGEKRVVKKHLRRFPRLVVVMNIDRFDCVWNVLCDSVAVINLIGIKIYNVNVLRELIQTEINRVVNDGLHSN
ncbi:hypothetical protein [Erinnyis ello granulovirus]|uniref:Uncharacterized protein n=1 Tax=Erinnyis ello granulovirus TaxID=307444 RepID=A0A097DAL8_9BBAC|nr:hypothetical protein [Erinnyis ello granulovirus]AIS92037.1 hypothetical protein [Erinnyis ello granulovirus]ARX71376.1 hypothetical protein EREL_037 [Erinnyis ello granulovirus]ARX71506.1 hypothetical protein EREL_037 [Erinnyis ello granulovirus]ARX71636.1 hypothetical protein EREL_037 [Erinnyis ello granulovirus]ARX71766.1 hypothetical protein EREL_037 [Erinnyis ello granulovirus]